jgi:hypothetical protein
MTQEKAMTTETPATQRLELLRNFKKYLEKQIAELEGESATLSEAARDFILEPENWEAYQDSKDSNSVAWPPEFLMLARAVEREFGPMPVEDEVQ